MNGDGLNISLKSLSASKSRDGRLGGKIVDEIEVRNENSEFSGSNSVATFDENLTPHSINIRGVDDFTGIYSEGINNMRPNGINTIKRKEIKRKLNESMSNAMVGVSTELKLTNDIIKSIKERQERIATRDRIYRELKFLPKYRYEYERNVHKIAIIGQPMDGNSCES